MDHQHSSKQRASVSSQHSEHSSFDRQHKAKHDEVEHYSTPVKKDRVINYTIHTPTKLHNHPPGWDRITWAPKICRKAVRRMDFGDIATAAH